MLHNEARELLVRGYEATHDAEGIAKAYSVSKWTVYGWPDSSGKTGSDGLANQPARPEAVCGRRIRKYPSVY